MKIHHAQMFAPLPGYPEHRPNCPLCRFLARASLADVRAAWGLERAAPFLDALARLDMAHRAMFANDTDSAFLFDEPAGSPKYAKLWLESFVHLLEVAPEDFLDAVPAAGLAMFLQAGADALGPALSPAASARGRALAAALEAEGAAKA